METQYTQRLDKIKAVLDKWLPQKPDASWLEMVFGRKLQTGSRKLPSALLESLAAPGWDLVNRGGKRWRPLLMALTAEAISGEAGLNAALPLTPLVEFPHNASLIHDDIEDNSDQRRGLPAVHLIYGNDTAINSGAFLYFLPMACLASGGMALDTQNRIWNAWASHMRSLHLGQAMDIAWHRDFHSLPSLEEYDTMCRLKTGCLVSLAATLGVYCSDKSFAQQDALAEVFGEAAEKLGVGFQILDDVKNLDTGNPGKKQGDDIVEGKKSLPVLLYLQRYPEKADFAVRCFAAARANGTEAPEVEEFIGAIKGAGVLEEAREKGLEYIRESRKIFSDSQAAGIPLREEGQKLLVGLMDLIG